MSNPLLFRSRKRRGKPKAPDTPRDLSSPVSTRSHVVEELKAEDTPQQAAEPSERLWDLAYDNLREEKGKLVDAYENILATETEAGLAIGPGIDREKQLLTLVATKLAVMKNKQWGYKFGDKSMEIREKVERIVSILDVAKDFISAAARLDPVSAGMPWVGVCMLLLLATNDISQRTAAVNGIEYISQLVGRYSAIERIYFQDEASDFEKDLRTAVLKLYQLILEFEATAVCQFDRNTVHQMARNAFKLDDWEGILDKVKSAASACNESRSIIDGNDQRKSRALDKILKQQIDKIQKQVEASYKDDEEFRKLHLEELKDTRVEQREWRLTDKEQLCHQTLRTSEYEKHKARNPDRVHGTCRWFLDHPNYKDWFESKNSALLWVSADPGCGKSVLSKSIIENEVKSNNSRTTCFFFFKDDNPDQSSASKALSALLHQLFSQKGILLKHATTEFEANGMKLPELFSRLWSILLIAHADPEAGEIICVLDALDECEVSGRRNLIDALNGLYHRLSDKGRGSLKFIVTSRPYFDIELRFKRLTKNLPTIRLAGEQESESISREISLVIEDVVEKIGYDLDLEKAIQALLKKRLMGFTHRTYLWLKLITDVIYKQLANTEKSLLKIIDTLPGTIDEAYNAILNRSIDFKQAKKLLHIVVSAKRPLTLQEMNIALAVEPDSRSYKDLDLEPELFFATKVRNLCGLFVSVIDSRIYLFHQTAKEFLVRSRDSKGVANDHILVEGQWKHSLEAAESNRILAKICMSYLCLAESEDDPLPLTRNLDLPHEDFVSRSHELISKRNQIYKLLDYAAHSWTTHFQRAIFEEESDEHQLYRKLCDIRSKQFRIWFSISFNTLALAQSP